MAQIYGTHTIPNDNGQPAAVLRFRQTAEGDTYNEYRWQLLDPQRRPLTDAGPIAILKSEPSPDVELVHKVTHHLAREASGETPQNMLTDLGMAWAHDHPDLLRQTEFVTEIAPAPVTIGL